MSEATTGADPYRFPNFFHPASHHMRVRKECVGSEATKNIFLKHNVIDNWTRLTGLALLHIHYNMDTVDFDEIIRRFARLHPRRMQLANILSD